MAKSARSSTIKNNNRRKYASVFSPAEAARNERLSAKLMELAKQPKPESSDVSMDAEIADDDAADDTNNGLAVGDTAMEVDSQPSKSRTGKKGVDRRRKKKSSIVFAKYSDRAGVKKKKKAPK